MVTHEHDVAAFASRIVSFRDGLVISDEPNAPHDAERELARAGVAAGVVE
jgi:putative ABC transport system ATP-binding protein